MHRPRLRSRAMPWGFDPNDSRAREGNHLASRVGYILRLAAAYGNLATAEQPLGSVLFQLDIFQRLLERGFFTVDFSCCAFGTPFQRPTRLLANNPARRALARGCTCSFRGQHLRLDSTFDRESLRKFVDCCRPDCMTVFGRSPRVGGALSEFSWSCRWESCRD